MKRTLAIALLLILLVGGLGAGLTLTMIGGLNTDFRTNSSSGSWVAACGGNNPTTGSDGKLLDQDKYIASWSPSLIGQRATIAGGYDIGKIQALGVDDASYTLTLYIEDSPLVVYSSKVTIPSGVGLSGIRCLAPAYWDIAHPDGRTIIPQGSVLQAKIGIHIIFGDWFYGVQESFIFTGIGDIRRNQDQVIVGETASWGYEVGYVSDDISGRGWTYSVYSTCSANIVVGPTVVTQTQGSFSYVVKPTDFSTGCRANELRASLKNELWSKDFDITTTITQEELANAPSCDIKGVSPQSPKQGETVTVSFSCSPASSAPAAAIDRISLRWGYGSIQNEIDLAAGTTSHSFVAGQSGFIQFMLIAYTVNNVPSGTDSVEIQVDHQPSKTILGGGNWNWLILIIAGVLLILGGIFAPVPLLLRLLAFGIAAILILIGYLSMVGTL